ncbi:hypothetical protein Adi01nite_39200 [Amorphoplanes digitatis]|nr:hypothetical protein Adi01nite_39200 [Actinoplanes digitatis]
MLERLPAGLQQQPLLRVHGDRLARRDAEEGGVEVARGDEAALAGGAAAPADQRCHVPAAVVRERGDAVATLVDQPPQRVRAVHAAGQAARHADDRDRLLPARFHLFQAAAGLVQVGRDPLEVVNELAVVGHASNLPCPGSE